MISPFAVEFIATSKKSELLDYCAQDVSALTQLFGRIQPRLDLPRAPAARSLHEVGRRHGASGIPMDVERLEVLKRKLPAAKSELIRQIDADYGVYEGGTFKADRFAEYVRAKGISWPRTGTGRLFLDENTFRQMARAHPDLMPLKELRATLSQMRLQGLAVGKDGRNRCSLSPFRSITGRNQPSTTAFIFGPAVWQRGLIKPAAGHGLAYLDWSQQEFGIAAALSQDRAMQEAYTSGDPYWTFARQAGAVPAGATKSTHKAVREQFKQCCLAVQYGMGAASLAIAAVCSVARATELLALHRKTYAEFWKWSDAAVDVAALTSNLQTVFGWQIQVTDKINARSLRNFPMQANGAEMLRLACCFATERGVGVCAPVHDAILIEAPLPSLDDAIEATHQTMAQASALVLDGFILRADVKVFRYPRRFEDDRGKRMWRTVWDIIDKEDAAPAV